MRFLYPTPAERRPLGRFYLASFFAEATHLAMPFKVLLVGRYLGLPQLGVVLLAQQLTSLLMEVPAGVWADRFGRKSCVLLGRMIVTFGWLLIPLATMTGAEWRLAAMCLCYAACGVGSALISGAHEAWVVDNLQFGQRPELIAIYFGRDRSLASLGGVVASVCALVLAGAIDLRWFWVVTGLGEFLALLLLWRVPEAKAVRITPRETEPRANVRSWRQTWGDGLSTIFKRHDLLAFTLMLVWLSLAFGASADVFQAALAESHLHEQAFAALALGVRCLSAVTPLMAAGLAEKFGSRSLMSGVAMLPGCAALIASQSGGLAPLTMSYLVATGCLSLLYAAADRYQHGMLPSAVRATASSAINMLVSLAILASTGLFTHLVGWLPASTVVTLMCASSLPAVLFLCPWRRRIAADHRAVVAPLA